MTSPSHESPAQERIPDLLLERVALGELPALELEQARRRIDADPDARARLAALTASNDEILATYPAAEMTQRINDRARIQDAALAQAQAQARRTPRPFLMAAPILATGALAVTFLVMTNNSTTSTSGGTTAGGAGGMIVGDLESTRTKGTPQLIVYRQNGGAQEQLARAAAVRPGDVLQLAYRAGGAAYGVILSIDGRGSVTVHYPDAAVATALDPNGVVALSHSYAIDDAPAYEIFFLVTRSTPFDVSEITDAARAIVAQGGQIDLAKVRLPLGDAFAQTSFEVKKSEVR